MTNPVRELVERWKREGAVTPTGKCGESICQIHRDHAADLERALAESCEWKDDDDAVWATNCGRYWVFTEGSPQDNNAKFCMGCGRPIVYALGEREGHDIYGATKHAIVELSERPTTEDGK